MSERLLLKTDKNRLLIEMPQSLKIACVQDSWPELKTLLNDNKINDITIDAAKLRQMDGSGGALIAYLEKKARAINAKFQVVGLCSELSPQLEAFKFEISAAKDKKGMKAAVENIGAGVYEVTSRCYENMSFIGKLSAGFWNVLRHPMSMRWKDAFMVSELAGVNSFGICATIGTLFGLILAFQSATAMQQFGAEIYVASLVSLSLFRVLGPFIAAILFSARSGSAFAAEIGTMKVNEEIDALVTMGLDPVVFLAVPRVVAGVVFVPLLAVFVNLFGLFGMFFVMMSLGYPFETIYQQTILLTTLTDMLGGVGKSFVFGFIVAGVGCLRGLQTGTGSKAVGQAATAAVVSGIVLTVVAEGIFSVIFYVLGI